MNPAFQKILKKVRMRHLVQVKRRIKDVATITGFVVDFNDSLILFHVLDLDVFRFNGYTVIRDVDASKFRVFDKAEYWQFRAVKHFGLTPVRPAGVSVDSLPRLVESVAAHYPLITLHLEKKNPDVCYIGSLLGQTERTVTISDLDCNAEWSGPRQMKFDDITRIDFGGGYEEALVATAPKKRSIKR